MLKDNVLLKEIPRVWYLRPFYIVLEVSSAGTFENFSQCSAVFFCFFFCFLLLLLFFVFFFFSFFFLCRMESRLSPV